MSHPDLTTVRTYTVRDIEIRCPICRSGQIAYGVDEGTSITPTGWAAITDPTDSMASLGGDFALVDSRKCAEAWIAQKLDKVFLA